jgi:hypothetical protein
MTRPTEKQKAAAARLGALLDQIDELTRHEGEPPLRQVVADHARAELGAAAGKGDDQ